MLQLLLYGFVLYLLVSVFPVSAGDGFFWNLILSLLGGGIVLFVFIGIIGFFSHESDKAKAPRKKGAEIKCREIINQHKSDLIRKRRRLISDRGYGLTDTSKWDREMSFFISNVLKPALGDNRSLIPDYELQQLINSCLDASVRSSKSKLQPAPPNGKPLEFEEYCASILERAGWKVLTTKVSGDQGADIVAKKNGLTVVVQCKQYSQPVGNAAVQEAYAAKAHYGADDAAVVTNASYTKSATELAESTGVLLLHQDDLPELIYKL